MPQWRDNLKCWLLMTNVCVTLIILVEAGHFNNENVIIRTVDGQEASYGASNVLQYVLIYGDMSVFSYNQAHATCKEIGGDLVKVENTDKRNWINSLGKDPVLIDGDLWLGISEKVSGSLTWAADCQSADPALTSGGTWATNKRCFIHRSEVFQFVRRSCTGNGSKYRFLCQTYTAVTEADFDVHPIYVNSEIPDEDCVLYNLSYSDNHNNNANFNFDYRHNCNHSAHNDCVASCNLNYDFSNNRNANYNHDINSNYDVKNNYNITINFSYIYCSDFDTFNNYNFHNYDANNCFSFYKHSAVDHS